MREKRTIDVAKWLCNKNTKKLFVKIIHPGGHVELHDRPILAEDIMSKNPESCVAYPYVFKQPWAIAAPNTLLLPGQKFYVVPISTVRKLQFLSKKYYASSRVQENETTTPNGKNGGDFHGKNSGCCLFRSSDHHPYKANCWMKTSNEDKRKETGLPKSYESSETEDLGNKRTKDHHISSPKRLSVSSFDQWQPSLESISEEF
ncbi:hypothetical protein ACH5RR_008265 [Cinchona calisaya]|uniref:Uncharacterized protein n=1 Tax=Cinchona calisaya TaxID=153742 RepID=A0ABD3ABK2_9GENT